MAQTSYTSTAQVSLATRRQAYERLCIILEHLDPLNLNLLSVVLNTDRTVTLTLSGPIPQGQLAHLSLEPSTP